MLEAHHAFHDWVDVAPYRVTATAQRDEQLWDRSALESRPVRSVRVLVAYANYADAPLTYRLGQWMLYDTEGFAYEARLQTDLYAGDALQRLKEGVILTGQHTQGWVAFEVPESARLAYLQFRSGYLSEHVASFRWDDDPIPRQRSTSL
ncbi:MAG: DUF4352 domain-containing protein [Bacteroidota bacterium]